MSSIIPKTAIFRKEQKQVQAGCQNCYRIVSELTKANYKLLQSYKELIETIESKMKEKMVDLELSEDMIIPEEEK